MKLDYPRYSERLGSLNIKSVQKVYELDSGKGDEFEHTHRTIKNISNAELEDVFSRMAIIIPIKGEKIKLLEGVISGIPHDCLVIIVSNSPRSPIDRFRIECNTLKQLVYFVDRDVIIVHQQDNKLANILREVGYTSILDENGIRDGKAEGMVIGMIIAKMVGKEYVGFIDADNYIPGAVNEYVKIFASGIIMSHSPYVMVRVSWIFKPKISNNRLYFSKLGRISEYTNRYLNSLISYYTGFETDIIKTGNAGEHAMSMRLAEILTFASGYSIEPYEIVNMMEEFGGLMPTHFPYILDEDVELLQIETRNPHLHEDKGKEHLDEMLRDSLSSIYFSKLCPPILKKQILRDLKGRRKFKKNHPKEPIYIQPIKDIDIDRFARLLMNERYSIGDKLSILI